MAMHTEMCVALFRTTLLMLGHYFALMCIKYFPYFGFFHGKQFNMLLHYKQLGELVNIHSRKCLTKCMGFNKKTQFVCLVCLWSDAVIQSEHIQHRVHLLMTAVQQAL